MEPWAFTCFTLWECEHEHHLASAFQTFSGGTCRPYLLYLFTRHWTFFVVSTPWLLWIILLRTNMYNFCARGCEYVSLREFSFLSGAHLGMEFLSPVVQPLPAISNPPLERRLASGCIVGTASCNAQGNVSRMNTWMRKPHLKVCVQPLAFFWLTLQFGERQKYSLTSVFTSLKLWPGLEGFWDSSGTKYMKRWG